MSIQHIPLEMVNQICKYMNFEDILSLDEALPTLSQCGVYFLLGGKDVMVRNHRNLEKAEKNYQLCKQYCKQIQRKLKRRTTKSRKKFLLKASDEAGEMLITSLKLKHRYHVEQVEIASKMGFMVEKRKSHRCLSCKKSFKTIGALCFHITICYPFCNIDCL